MKKSITIYTILLVLSFSALAEMKDRQQSTSSSQMRLAQTKQVMSREMMRNMLRIMQQIQTMTRDMNRIMENTATMDKTRTREMARIMEQLSLAMHKMSQHMENRDMNKNMHQEMERNVVQISEMIKKNVHVCLVTQLAA